MHLIFLFYCPFSNLLQAGGHAAAQFFFQLPQVTGVKVVIYIRDIPNPRLGEEFIPVDIVVNCKTAHQRKIHVINDDIGTIVDFDGFCRADKEFKAFILSITSPL